MTGFTGSDKRREHFWTILGEPLVIVGNTDELKKFIEDVEEKATRPETDKTVTRKAHKRRAYPGGPQVDVKGGSVTRREHSGARRTNTLAGRSFTLAKGADILGIIKWGEKRTFTLAQGTTRQLRELLKTKRKLRVLLITPDGANVAFKTPPLVGS